MSSRIFNIFSEYIRRNPLKVSFASIPPLVLTIGNIQKQLGILPTNSILYNYSKKIVEEPEFGFYTSPK